MDLLSLIVDFIKTLERAEQKFVHLTEFMKEIVVCYKIFSCSPIDQVTTDEEI